MIGPAIAAGFVATLVMTTIMRGASQFGLTRIDFALLLGTTVSDNRRKARAYGYVFHFVVGILFALAYVAFFQITGRSGWFVGALLGTVHAVSTGPCSSTCCCPSSIRGLPRRKPPRTTSP